MTSRYLAIASGVCLTGLVLGGCARQSPQVASNPPPPLASAPGVGQEIKAVAQNKLTVTFAEGSDRLTPEANKELDVAARLFRDVNPVMMFSIGHSDAQGDEFSNVLLSARRARTVKAALVARGIPPDRLAIQALGESEPANSSDRLSRENRRVTVMWRIV